MLNLKDINKSIKKESLSNSIKIESISNKDVAIIGISCRFASADNKEEYWGLLKNGMDCIRDFPESRKKLNECYLRNMSNDFKDDEYFTGGFLKEIDQFDFEFFNISSFEANLMSPNQRVFLETAWSALEDAGYGGNKISCSKTGVFLGHSTDFGVNYKDFIETLNPSLAGFAISGNLNSIIAGRISYLLDLKGPSMVIDTACSSSLAAVHSACLSLRNEECEMALVGSVKIDLLPLKSIKSREDEIGITSSDGIARTFDDSSEGTGLGEGVGAILLKPLSKALEDGDNIYAVIKGSAVNQDGSSVNLTAPNPAAQGDVIIKACQDAGIDPKTITYIEAHGTGTKLGDPIEINGIERAFRINTKNKQFCGIGSVKTNIGHLDHAAGLAGLIKAILSLKNKSIPPSLHFKFPNKKINFEDSPVYVNDILREWESCEFPRRCGVSAFGLSGTNCHVILEEAKQPCDDEIIKGGLKALTLSAKNREGIEELIWQYQIFLHKQKDVNLNSVCYTANTGRGHYNCRLAIVFEHIDELKIKLEKAMVLEPPQLVLYDTFYGECQVVSEQQKARDIGGIKQITQNQKLDNTNYANRKIKGYFENHNDLHKEFLLELCEMYINGSDIEWDLIYRGSDNKRVNLPTYPFSKNTCWVLPSTELDKKEPKSDREIHHPLIKVCLAQSYDRITYLSIFDVDKDWIINEHKVAGSFVMPGTAFIEMISEILNRHYYNWDYQLKNILFISPLVAKVGEKVEAHTILELNNEIFRFSVSSRSSDSDEWRLHVEGEVSLLLRKNPGVIEIERIKKMHNGELLKHYAYKPGEEIETGPRWDCIKKTYITNDGILSYLCMNEKYENEMNFYNLHPALLDEAVNIALRSVGEGLYLPFSYKSITVFKRLPSKIYSYVMKKNTSKTSNEFVAFDITLVNESGKKLAVIEEYTIKKADEMKVVSKNVSHNVCYSKIVWKEDENSSDSITNDGKSMLVLKGEGEVSNNIVREIKKQGKNIIEVELGNRFEKIHDGRFVVCPIEDDYSKIFEYVKVSDIGTIIYMHTLSNTRKNLEITDLITEQDKGVYGLFNLTKALVKQKFINNIDFNIIVQYAYEVNKRQRTVFPEDAAVVGVGKSIGLEHPYIKCRCIDIDEYTPANAIVQEIKSQYRNYLVAYRYGKRFTQYIDTLDIDNVQSHKTDIRGSGVYIITGGTGAIGLEIAKLLSSSGPVNIALINRSVFPPVEKWNEIAEGGADANICKKILLLSSLKKNGSTITLCHADVSDLEKMREVISDLRSKFTRINGVFHIAGNAGDGFIRLRTKSDFRNVLAPKIEGTWVLDRLTQEDELDFFVMFSSVSSIISEAGQADYAGANSYLDSYSNYAIRNGKRFIAINWPAWSETGMAVEYKVDLTKEIFSPISTAEAVDVMINILNKNINGAVIGKLNFGNYNMNQMNILGFSPEFTEKLIHSDGFYRTNMYYSKNLNSNIFDIVLLGREDGGSYSKTERDIAKIIGSVLNLKEINIYDDFLDLGGNSIIAVKIEMDLKEKNIPLNVEDLYQYKTVRNLAQHLDGAMDARVFQSGERKLVEQHTLIGNKLSGIQPFNEVLYKTCFHNSLFPVIAHLGKDIAAILVKDVFVYDFDENVDFSQNGMRDLTEKPLSEILNDLGIEVKTKNHFCSKAKDITPPPDDIELLISFSNYIGMEELEKKTNTANLISDIESALLNKRPVIIWVDCFYESIRKDTYNKEHWMHTLLLYGFDKDKEVFFAIEHELMDNLTYKEKEISYKDILESYEGFIANYRDFAKMPTYYEFSMNSANPNNSDIDVQNYKYMFCKSMLEKKDIIEVGLEKLKSMNEKICGMILDEYSLKEHIDGLIIVFNRIINNKRLEKHNISNLFIDTGIKTDIEKVINAWINIRQLLIKYSYSYKYDNEKMMSAVKSINEIYQTEYKYYRQLFILLNAEFSSAGTKIRV